MTCNRNLHKHYNLNSLVSSTYSRLDSYLSCNYFLEWLSSLIGVWISTTYNNSNNNTNNNYNYNNSNYNYNNNNNYNYNNNNNNNINN